MCIEIYIYDFGFFFSMRHLKFFPFKVTQNLDIVRQVRDDAAGPKAFTFAKCCHWTLQQSGLLSLQEDALVILEFRFCSFLLEAFCYPAAGPLTRIHVSTITIKQISYQHE